jgi:hypothetical protein
MCSLTAMPSSQSMMESTSRLSSASTKTPNHVRHPTFTSFTRSADVHRSTYSA